LLVKELRELNPWYVYRNLLQVVASIAHDVRDASETTDALTVATEKLRHPDARVRTEALTAAVRIAREQSAPHIILGLEDGTTAVVARALSLANVAQHPRILELLLRCVEPGNLSGEGADAGRAAAVMALGQYREPSAVAALLRILQPGMLGLLFQRDDALRAAAAAALGHHSGDIAVRQALERASNDRDARVCTAARRALARPPA
jgi:HEAT repeat protein